MSKTLWIVIIAIIVLGGVWYFTTPVSTTPVNPDDRIMQPVVEINTPPVTDTASTTGTTTVSVKEFNVTGKDYSFTPTTITVNVGDTVKINFNNVDGFHDFVIDEFDAKTKRINEGQNDIVTFVADKAGTFEYYCSVGQHRAIGMKGTLVVN